MGSSHFIYWGDGWVIIFYGRGGEFIWWPFVGLHPQCSPFDGKALLRILRNTIPEQTNGPKRSGWKNLMYFHFEGTGCDAKQKLVWLCWTAVSYSLGCQHFVKFHMRNFSENRELKDLGMGIPKFSPFNWKRVLILPMAESSQFAYVMFVGVVTSIALTGDSEM